MQLVKWALIQLWGIPPPFLSRPMHASGGRQLNTGNLSWGALGAAVDDEDEAAVVFERWQLQGTSRVNVQLLLRRVVELLAAVDESVVFSLELPSSSSNRHHQPGFGCTMFLPGQ